ncbi:hypothetical protein M0804_013857 [Polistes exclamans]|nr:hypothetical protein M0804_013857 [Polistes exclamans]
MSGKQQLANGMSITNMLNEEALENIAESTVRKVLDGFCVFIQTCANWGRSKPFISPSTHKAIDLKQHKGFCTFT